MIQPFLRAAHWSALALSLLLLAACARPPRQDLDATEYLVARAYAIQGPKYAPNEYRSAFSALEDGRRLIDKHDYPGAVTALTFARQHALRAYDIAFAIKSREAAEAEARRLAEEEEARKVADEARRKAEIEARRKAEIEARRRIDEEARRAAEARMLTEYRVGSNDTLASIAALVGVYGDSMLWPLLYQANRDQIKDPSLVYVGQVLKIPRGLPASDLENARQKARESGLFNLSQGNGTRH